MRERGPVDLNQFASNPRYSVEVRTIETETEQNARLQREADDARHRRQIFWAVFAVMIAALLVSLAIALWSGNDDNQAWARTIFSAIVAGLIGFAGGNAMKPIK